MLSLHPRLCDDWKPGSSKAMSTLVFTDFPVYNKRKDVRNKGNARHLGCSKFNWQSLGKSEIIGLIAIAKQSVILNVILKGCSAQIMIVCVHGLIG